MSADENELDAASDSAFLHMSDEEFAQLDPAELAPEFTQDEDEDDDSDDTEQGTEDSDSDLEDGDESESGPDVYAGSSDDSSTADSDNDGGDDGSVDSESDDEGDVDGESENSDDPATLKTFVDQITAPFKANGKTMKIENADDAVRLMQKGANYNLKMASMKPHLKVLKTLEKNEIDEEKLNFLIDLDRNDPGAIARLLKQSEIDPIDFDTDRNEKQYKATDHSVEDREIAFDEVLDEIKDSDTYARTLDVVGGQWDDASKRAVTDAPELLRLMNDHMASGVYDVISNQLTQERALGRLNGLSDIEAYREVGDAIQAKGGFDHLFQQEERQQAPPSQERSTEPKQEAKSRREKRKAASPTKSAPGKKKADFNPLGMSDDAFLEQIDERFI